MKIEFDVREIKKLAGRIESIGETQIREPLLAIVNRVATTTRIDALASMTRAINLPASYVEPKLTLTLGSNPVQPLGVITGLGGQITNLERYFRTGGNQLSVAVRWPNGGAEPGGRNPRKPGAKLPWIPRVGAPKLGIPVGRKQAGLQLSVVKGAPSVFPHAFLFTPKAGGGRLIGSRAKGDRTGKGKINTKVGPSVYQLFRAALTPDFIKQVEDVLSKNVLDSVESTARKAFE